MDELTINVTARHIEHGTKQLCELCPIALAAQDLLGPDYWIMVRTGSMVIRRKHPVADTKSDYYPLPPEAKEFIKAFDNGRPVEPFSFTCKKGEPAWKSI